MDWLKGIVDVDMVDVKYVMDLNLMVLMIVLYYFLFLVIRLLDGFQIVVIVFSSVVNNVDFRSIFIVYLMFKFVNV